MITGAAVQELYISASPDFVNLDADREGSAFAELIGALVANNLPSTLILDLSESFVDYFGCGPVIVGAIEAMRALGGSETRTIAIITTIDYGTKARYADLFFKGTKFERSELSFLDIAYRACRENNLELKVWIVPSGDFKYSGLAELKGANVVLSSR